MSRTSQRSLLCTAMVALTLGSACAPRLQDKSHHEPNVVTPATFLEAKPAKNIRKQGVGQIVWTHYFKDPELKSLIAVALKNNQELNMLVQEIIVAKAEVMARQGEYQPKVSAGVGAGVDKVGGRSSQGVSDDAHNVPVNLADFSFGLLGSWEVDIWKKLRNATKAANYRYLATIEGRNFVITQLVAEISRSYYELVALDKQIEVLKKNIAIQMDALAVVRLEKLAARVTELAVQRFEAEVLKNKSRLFDMEQARVQTENKINFLLGRYPQPIARLDSSFDETLPELVQTGVPTDLLENRPDLRRASLRLEAAKLDVKIAKAAFYPALSIEAGVGYQSFNLKHLLVTPESLVYNLAGNLVAPLINRKAIKAQYQAADALQLQAVYNYERTLLQAFTDVANQLAMIKNLKLSYDLQAEQVAKLQQAIEVSGILFQSARADYMEVLLTRRDTLDAELEMIETKKRQLLAMVNVYQALGGGWKYVAVAHRRVRSTMWRQRPCYRPSLRVVTASSFAGFGSTRRADSWHLVASDRLARPLQKNSISRTNDPRNTC